MIKVNGIQLRPTIFPDGTSQIWHLPKILMETDRLEIDWRFESEREILDLFSLRALLPDPPLHLYIPFLPYGRQDKSISNDSTFNLTVFLKLLKNLNPAMVSTLDAHNPVLCYATLPFAFENISAVPIQKILIDKLKPGTLIFPDKGAQDRYDHDFSSQLVFKKIRDQATGKIISHEIEIGCKWNPNLDRFLIIDDICDGGATFVSIAQALKRLFVKPKVMLFTTHGIYSKGLLVLKRAGITPITTNSLKWNDKNNGVIKV